MNQKKLYDECAACWCLRNKRCEGRYHNVEYVKLDDGTTIESSEYTLADLGEGFPGDRDCGEKLITVNDGCLYINYAYQYPVRPVSDLTKKVVAEFVTHLMSKTWFSILLLRVFVRRTFALKGWEPTLEIDVSRM